MSSIFDLMDADGAYKPPRITDEQLIFRAASSNNLPRLRELLKNATSEAPILVGKLINGLNSLHVASMKGHNDIVTYLIDLYPELLYSEATQDKKTAVMFSAQEGKLSTLKLLASLGQRSVLDVVDARGNSALHFAAWGGSLECTQFLIESGGMSPSICNAEGLQPLQFAVAGNHLPVVEYLTRLNATQLSSTSTSDSNLGSSHAGYTALHRAAMYGSVDALKLLLKSSKWSTVDLPSSVNSTPLHIAAHNGYLEIVSLLVQDYNADLHWANNFGLTALHYAAIGGHADVCYYLLKRGADPNTRNSAGATALHMAAAGGHKILCNLIGSVPSVDLFAKDNENATPIDAALNNSFKEVASQIAYLSSIRLHTEVRNDCQLNYNSSYEHELKSAILGNIGTTQFAANDLELVTIPVNKLCQVLQCIA